MGSSGALSLRRGTTPLVLAYYYTVTMVGAAPSSRAACVRPASLSFPEKGEGARRESLEAEEEEEEPPAGL